MIVDYHLHLRAPDESIDAHVPQDVGRDLDCAVEHARNAGYDTVTVFEAREGREEQLG